MSPVFDENKYRALLEKLEIHEVKLLEASLDNEDFRIDSGFYTKIIPQRVEKQVERKNLYKNLAF